MSNEGALAFVVRLPAAPFAALAAGAFGSASPFRFLPVDGAVEGGEPFEEVPRPLPRPPTTGSEGGAAFS